MLIPHDDKFMVSEWPLPLPDFGLDPASTALVIVDMQELARSNGALGRAVGKIEAISEYVSMRESIAIPNQRELLNWFRAHGGRLIFLTIGAHAADGSDDTPWRKRRNAKLRLRMGVQYPSSSSLEHEIITELRPEPGEIVLNKASFGAFGTTGLDQILRNWGIKFVVFCGQSSHACVYQTATEAADRGYESLIVEDASVGWDERLHVELLRNFSLIFGRVSSTQEVLVELDTDPIPGGASAKSSPSGIDVVG